LALLVFWIMCGIATSMIFKNKGRDAFGGFLLGALLGPFGILFAFFWSSDERQIESRAITSGALRKCPDCAEMVRAEARKCRFCNADLEPIDARELEAQTLRPRVAGRSPKCGCKRCYVKS
jgi:hypothetical protein